MPGSLKLYPPSPKATARVHLRDEGQDFLWLDIGETKAGHKVVGCGPFQEWMWKGKRVKAERLKVGSQVPICLNRRWTTLRYPVKRVEALR